MDLPTNLFIAGYLANIVATGHLVRSIMADKHIEGLSFQTQIIFAVAMVCKTFYFGPTMLSENFLGWIELPLSLVLSAMTLYYFHKYKRLSLSPEKSFRFTAISIPACFFVSIFVHPGFMEEGFDFSSMMIAMASYLEAIAFIPQLQIIKKEGHIKKSMGVYIIALSISRLLRVAFWLALWLIEGGYFWSIIFADMVYVIMVADLIYFYLKYRHEPSILLDR